MNLNYVFALLRKMVRGAGVEPSASENKNTKQFQALKIIYLN